jgi:hypothetical protein
LHDNGDRNARKHARKHARKDASKRARNDACNAAASRFVGNQIVQAAGRRGATGVKASFTTAQPFVLTCALSLVATTRKRRAMKRRARKRRECLRSIWRR